jgi:ribose-phosphate pyrophosphokinase
MKAADLMMEKGALSNLYTRHLIWRCLKNRKSQLLELIVTDSIPLKKQSDKIRVLSCLSCRCYAHGAP